MRYVHTNLLSSDWKMLACFYMDVFECEPFASERDLAGDWLDRATGLEKAHIRGIHLKLPGFGEGGPTLEIFEYDEPFPESSRHVNQAGFGHIAFQVEDVSAVWEKVILSGGSKVGEIVTTGIPGVGVIRFAYVRDPEGNIIELQSWAGTSVENYTESHANQIKPVKAHSKYTCIYDMVAKIPMGRVATYGQIARLCRKCTARMVGYALAALPDGTDLSWHRVVNAGGGISKRRAGFGDLLQRELLMEEGLTLDQYDRIDLSKYGWDGSSLESSED